MLLIKDTWWEIDVHLNLERILKRIMCKFVERAFISKGGQPIASKHKDRSEINIPN